jgi:ABC-type branched-subunit amino acid transport system substrate-binding protein
MQRRHFVQQSTALGASVAAAPYLASSALAQSNERIVLGQSAAFTGPAAQLGIQFAAGARLYFDQVNTQGMLGRRSIELLRLDDGYEPERCAAYIREARRAGFGGSFFNVSFVGTQALADELGKDGAGIVVSQVMPSPYRPANAITREFAEAVKTAAQSTQINFSSMEGYLAAKVLTEGLKRAAGKTLTRDGLIEGLESLGNQNYGGFTVSFSPTDHVASSFVELSMLTGDGRVRT